ncbi:hypothetical protein [Actinophytocola sediminis]
MEKRLEYRYFVGERSWTLDFFDVAMSDWILLERATGWSYAKLLVEHDRASMLATLAMLWMARRRAGEPHLQFDDKSLQSLTLRDLRRETVHDGMETAAEDTGGKGSGRKAARPTRAPRAPKNPPSASS